MNPTASNHADECFAHDTSADEMAAVMEDLAARRQRGEALLAPLSFRQLEAMAKRLPDQTRPVRRILLARLKQTLARHEVHVQKARDITLALAASAIDQEPEQAREAKRFLAAGDLTALQRLCRLGASKHDSPLAELNSHIEQVAQAGAETHMGIPAGGKVDMKSLRQFKDSWARIAAQDDVKQAMERGPQNAGPLNSHQLVLRSLSLMRDVSPDYLRRFMTHLDALLWLDQCSPKPTAAEGKPKAKNPRTKA